MAETFIPNPENYPVVHHKDGNKLNPKVGNLEWTTAKGNVNYSLEAMSQHTFYYNNRKLNKEQVIFIKQSQGKKSSRELSNMFKVSKTTIISIWSGKSYKDYL